MTDIITTVETSNVRLSVAGRGHYELVLIDDLGRETAHRIRGLGNLLIRSEKLGIKDRVLPLLAELKGDVAGSASSFAGDESQPASNPSPAAPPELPQEHEWDSDEGTDQGEDEDETETEDEGDSGVFDGGSSIEGSFAPADSLPAESVPDEDPWEKE